MNAEEVNRWVDALGDYRARSQAIRALVKAGPDAVHALKATLHNPREGTRWAVARCLARIKTPDALKALVDALDSPDGHDEALEALRSEIRRDIGDDPVAWRDWLQQGGVVDTGGELSDDDLVKQAAAKLEAELTQAKQGWVANVRLDGGRHQRVKIAFGRADNEGAPIVIVYSECGPASAERYEWALRKNISMPFGAIALRDVDGQPHFVVFNTLLRSDCSPEGLRKSIATIAARGDRIEKMLTGEDER